MKAALAGVAGAGLLLGGAGSLAYWTDAESQDGGTIESGTLNLIKSDCSAWTTGTTATTPFDDDYLIVPGDSFERTCDFTLSVKGDVNATLSVDDQAVDASVLGGELAVATEYELRDAGVVDESVSIDEATDWPFTEADTGRTLRATITVELPWDGDPSASGDQVGNASNSMVGDEGKVALSAALESLTVTVTQAP